MAENITLTEATYFILLALVQPNHGYGIMLKAEEMSNGRVRLAAGTLYGALNNMVEKGWIEQLPAESGSRKKEYSLTDLGLEILINETKRLKELAACGDEVLKGAY
ncbi:MAG: helix-turn-helix transcriptional regulator [Solobacterium sp.]|nr:helix-turn-helix transcriptional regulator [Solobacterium sp.]